MPLKLDVNMSDFESVEFKVRTESKFALWKIGAQKTAEYSADQIRGFSKYFRGFGDRIRRRNSAELVVSADFSALLRTRGKI